MHIVCAEVQDIVGPDKFASMPVCVISRVLSPACILHASVPTRCGSQMLAWAILFRFGS